MNHGVQALIFLSRHSHFLAGLSSCVAYFCQRNKPIMVFHTAIPAKSGKGRPLASLFPAERAKALAPLEDVLPYLHSGHNIAAIPARRSHTIVRPPKAGAGAKTVVAMLPPVCR